MRIIEIKSLSNGAHRNQTGYFNVIPEGYAQIPNNMDIPDTFPFVDIEVGEETRYKHVPVVKDIIKTKKILVLDDNGEPIYDEEGRTVTTSEEYRDTVTVIEKVPYTVTVVTSMTAGVMPEPEPTSEPETTAEELTVDDMANAILEGVNDI